MNWGTEWFLGAKKRKSRGQLGIRVKGEQNKVQRLMSNSGEKLRKNEEEEEKSKLKGKKWGGGKSTGGATAKWPRNPHSDEHDQSHSRGAK